MGPNSPANFLKAILKAPYLSVGGTAFKPDRTSPAGKLRGQDVRRYCCNVGVGLLYVRLIRDGSGITVQEGEAAGDTGEEEEDEEEGDEEDEEGEDEDDEGPPPAELKQRFGPSPSQDKKSRAAGDSLP